MKNSPRPHRNRLSVSLAKARRHRASRHHTTIQFEPLEDRRVLSADYQSLDGTGNNVSNPDWGSTGVQLLRIADVDYGNGIATPAGSDRASARQISNAVVSQSGSIFNDRYMSDFVWQWGQFLDHDIDLTDAASPAQSFPITVPTGDAYFDPTGTGTQTIGLNRSEYDSTTGTSVSNPRQQINAITAWIDASQIYGSDAARAAAVSDAIDAQIDCVVHLLLNSGAVTNVQLVHYTLNAREPTAGMPQVVVSPVVLRETLDLAWRFRDGTGDLLLVGA